MWLPSNTAPHLTNAKGRLPVALTRQGCLYVKVRCLRKTLTHVVMTIMMMILLHEPVESIGSSANELGL
jgi:hypothetical protein